MSTAGIIIIGDEILKGFTVDTNSHFLCKGLYNLGIKVGKISVVGDKIEDIADEVSSFSKKYTYVLTSGGIGPTHDDVTFAGVAAAFDDNLEQNHRIVDLLKNYYEKMQLDLAADQKYSDESKRKLRAASKLAMIPSTSTLYHPGDANNSTKQQFPLVRVRNVYIFPGIPSYLERSFTYFRYVFQRSATFYHEFLYVTRDEFGITDKLNVATDKFGNSVSFGSYPDVLNQYYKVKITVDSGSEQDTKDASNFLRSTIPDSCFINMESASVARSDRHVYGLLRCDVRDDQKSSFTMELGNALNVLEEAVDKFNQDEICLSFNGGKDCTVLLHLFSAVLRKKFGQDGVRDILTLYVSSSDTFPEVDDFIENTKIR
ncbi:FLAD1 (predicted) [Pycnogonum litorale]